LTGEIVGVATKIIGYTVQVDNKNHFVDFNDIVRVID
jgi:hypothetical protein